MIRAVFFKKNGSLVGFSISGHSGYADSGSDIVCASVSSAAQLVINTITESFEDKADVDVGENELKFMLSEPHSDYSKKLLYGFYTHLKLIKEEFSPYVDIRMKLT